MPDSFQRPVGDDPRDPLEKYRVEQVEKDQLAQNEPPPQDGRPPERPLWAILAAYLSLAAKKIIDLFEEMTEHGLAESAEKDLREHLILFKTVLEILKKEDHSQDAPFLGRLSELWQPLLEDLHRFRKRTPLCEQLNRFIKELENYPEKQEHSLGYYLTQSAGRTWLPLPYIEMIHHLHIQHHKTPAGSTLSRWTNLLSQLISSLPPKIDRE